MPNEYGKHFIFQLFATAELIKKVSEGQHSDSVMLVTYLLTSIIQDQQSLVGLDCAAIRDVKDSSDVASGKTKVLFA